MNTSAVNYYKLNAVINFKFIKRLVKIKKIVWKLLNNSVARFIRGRTRTTAGTDSNHWIGIQKR